jgi:hypothetical protein
MWGEYNIQGYRIFPAGYNVRTWGHRKDLEKARARTA